jgi:hypothetical protein
MWLAVGQPEALSTGPHLAVLAKLPDDIPPLSTVGIQLYA